MTEKTTVAKEDYTKETRQWRETSDSKAATEETKRALELRL